MNSTLMIANILVCVLIVVFILLQGRGAGLGSAWGGGGETFQTRRGVEKVVMRFTVLLILVFLVISLVSIAMSK